MLRFAALAAFALSATLIAQTPPAERVVRLPQGTKVPVVLAHGVSAKSAKPGDRVILRTLRPVSYRGALVIPEGSMVEGEVEQASAGGRSSRIVIAAGAILLEAGGRIALDGALLREGPDYGVTVGGSGGPMAGGGIAIPLGRKNASPNLEAGTAFIATTARDW